MKYFGTDGIRGVFGETLTDDLAFKVGKALGEMIENEKVIIGKDTRVSGDSLEAALSAGITSMGVDVLSCGILPTPAVALLTRITRSFGVVISASHNPPEYNGIKILKSGYKIPDKMEEEIEKRLEKEDFSKRYIVGRVKSFKEGKDMYIGAILEMFKDLDLTGERVSLDLANGATTVTAKDVFEFLGASVEVFNHSQDGLLINQGCGATHPKFLAEQMKNGKIGFTFDGDGDRVLAVDEERNVINGDKIIGILANGMMREGRLKNNMVVGTVMTNGGLEEYLKGKGVKLVRTKVGDKYVLEEMLRLRSNLGGERSGHIIILDRSTTGDGLITALEIMRILKNSGKALSELAKVIPDYPQITKNVKRTEKTSLESDELKKLIEKITADGYRVVVRPSGTEPVIRITVEGKNREEIEEIVEKLSRAIES
ncbi:phosphoglucosamine mutase [Thermotoga sp. KOL6]|uniref:phosphoglucosamine mutase n=1 Tax=Thermotoga sp. KOL6 TaxID=126741 RepID=UPI00004EAA2B|nr:phosphoglucosamine mutase [Thermotoga sp. KOL6]PLV58773.1 phosphoglucosamine mutase [Thermotoga sp. KOL6]CAI44392.1 phosphoglucomutase/phosphomannomutase family protein [Thermotoga sp. KOL6]